MAKCKDCGADYSMPDRCAGCGGHLMAANADPRDAEIVRLKAEVERLQAALDGDPEQTATPEQRRAWRQSAVRYADAAESARDKAFADHSYKLAAAMLAARGKETK